MNINKIIIIQIQKYLKLFIFALIIIISSCSPIYVPTSINTPLFEEAGEVQFSGYTGTHQLQARIAYTPVNHIGLMFNTAFNNHRYLDWFYNDKSTFFELGIGYYSKLSENFVFETYGGYGKGTMQYSDYYDQIDIYDVQKIFLTPAVGFVSEYLDVGFSLRYLNYTSFNDSENLNSDFIEPCMTLKAGVDNIKLISDFGVSLNLGNNIKVLNWPIFFNFGAQLSLFKNKKFHIP